MFRESICTGGPQLPACKNDDFYWLLALAVTKNATINRFTTATIELLCTSVYFITQLHIFSITYMGMDTKAKENYKICE
jgi:quinol-cytochrome oxidoreductase complex cytochrome b subunit